MFRGRRYCNNTYHILFVIDFVATVRAVITYYIHFVYVSPSSLVCKIRNRRDTQRDECRIIITCHYFSIRTYYYNTMVESVDSYIHIYKISDELCQQGSQLRPSRDGSRAGFATTLRLYIWFWLLQKFNFLIFLITLFLVLDFWDVGREVREIILKIWERLFQLLSRLDDKSPHLILLNTI